MMKRKVWMPTLSTHAFSNEFQIFISYVYRNVSQLINEPVIKYQIVIEVWNHRYEIEFDMQFQRFLYTVNLSSL